MILRFFYLVIVLIAVGCNDDLGIDTVDELSVSVALPSLDIEIVDESYTFKNIATGASTTYSSVDSISLKAGLYDCNYNATGIVGGIEVSLRSNLQSVEIFSGCEIVFEPSIINTNKDFVIEEIFFTGTVTPEGKQYRGDQYIKIYNNTADTLYADNLAILESTLHCANKYDLEPNLIETHFPVWAIYVVPGSGQDVPVAPGSSLLIADIGIDHRVENSNSIDLSMADFEWYDVSSSAANQDIDSDVPNLDKWYCYTNSIWILHNRGFRAYAIARMPVDAQTYLAEYKSSYDYVIVSSTGYVSYQSKDTYIVPNEWIIDGVQCSVEGSYKWSVINTAIDCGWTYCGGYDGDKTRFGKSVLRKTLYTDETTGHRVLKDTNNSTDDFIADHLIN